MSISLPQQGLARRPYVRPYLTHPKAHMHELHGPQCVEEGCTAPAIHRHRRLKQVQGTAVHQHLQSDAAGSQRRRGGQSLRKRQRQAEHWVSKVAALQVSSTLRRRMTARSAGAASACGDTTAAKTRLAKGFDEQRHRQSLPGAPDTAYGGSHASELECVRLQVMKESAPNSRGQQGRQIVEQAAGLCSQGHSKSARL